MFKSTSQNSFQNPFPTEGAAVAAESWWLAGGIDVGDCVSAYQPKGAASLAASYSNLNNPGTFDLTLGKAPLWDAVNGWIFDGLTSARYLITGITPAGDQTWSVIAKYSNAIGTFGYIAIDFGLAIGIRPLTATGNRLYFAGGKNVTGAGNDDNGVMAVAGRQGYYNGASDGAVIASGSSTPQIIQIARFGNSEFLYDGYVQALSIYNVAITAPQVLAVTNAMNLL